MALPFFTVCSLWQWGHLIGYTSCIATILNGHPLKHQYRILSAEDFSAIGEPEIADFRRFLQERFKVISIVAYIRNAENLYDSLIQQWIRQGCNSPNKLTLPHNFRCGFKQKIEAYIHEFGRENISVMKFLPDNLAEGDIVKDFQQRFLQKEAKNLTPINSMKYNEFIPAAVAVCLIFVSDKIPRYQDNKLNPK